MTAAPILPTAEPMPSGIVVPELPNDVDAMTAALAYAKGGIHVGPQQHCSKHPGSVLGNAWQTQTSTDPKQIVAWFAGEDHGVFIHGLGLVIFDVDRPDKVPDWMWRHLDTAPFQRSRDGGDPRKGHYLFACPRGRQFGNSLGSMPKGWGEIRGLGGMVVAAPTRHVFEEDGGRYHWARTGSVPVLPREIAEMLPDAGPGERVATSVEVRTFLDAHLGTWKTWLADIPAKRFTHQVQVEHHSRHEACVAGACWITRDAAAGLYPARDGLTHLWSAFRFALDGERPARSEFERILAWAIGQIKPEEIEALKVKHSSSLTPAPTTGEAPGPTLPAASGDDAAGDYPLPEPPEDEPEWIASPAEQKATQAASLFDVELQRELARRAARKAADDIEMRGMVPDDDGTHGDAPRATWGRTDLTDFVNGDYEAPVPTLMPREDGVCLLYPGLVHSFHGESESGKSWVLQAEAARCVKAALAVLYVDFESDAGSVTDRLMELGCTPAQILAHFDYRNPEMKPTSVYELEAWQDMMGRSYALAVIDGVTDSLGIWNAKSNDGDEVSGWMRAFPRQLAARTGAAVGLIDHVTKNADTRGRFATGSQMKMAGLTGAAYMVEVEDPLGRGLKGRLSIRVGKDRPGSVRGHGGEMRKTDRTQLVAQFVLDATGMRPGASLVVPDDSPKQFRPTALMERVSLFLAASPGATGRTVTDSIQGKATYVRAALTLLVSEGYVATEVAGRSVKHTVIKPYTEADDSLCVLASRMRPNASQDASKSMRPASPPPIGGDAYGSTPGGTSEGVNASRPRRRTSRVPSRATDDCVSCGKPCETEFDGVVIHPNCPPTAAMRSASEAKGA